MSTENTIMTRETHPKLFLPEDPFPFPFASENLQPTLKDWLKVQKRHPAYGECTHEAAYRLLFRQGTNNTRLEATERLTGRPIATHNAIGKRLYGVEEYSDQIVTGYFGQAAQGGRARRKALAVTGSPGAGKSDLVNLFQYDLMRQREPIPFLAGSPMWCNPYNALFLVKLIAARKTARRRDKMIVEVKDIIESLDFTGESEIDFGRTDVTTITAKYGFKRGEKLNSEQLASIVMKSEKDFVSIVAYGLGASKATVESLVMPDPWAQDVVLGEFFGTNLINPEVLAPLEGVVKTLNGKALGEVKAKTKRDATYGRFDPSLAVNLADFPLDIMYMSEGHGLVDVSEVQPINFDLKVWRGDQDISAIGLYDDRDPRTVSPSGVFNKGKVIVLTEGFRNPPEGFRVLLEGLEGQRLSLPEPLNSFFQQGVGWEGLILIHSNDEQWNKFWSNPDHRAHNDRLHWVSWKYPLEPAMATAATEKLYKASSYGRPQSEGGVHLEPLLLAYTGFFRVASHLHWESKAGLPFMGVLRAYNGQTLRQPGMGTEIDVRGLREKAPWTEGLDGMSPREMDSILGELAANAQQSFAAGERSAAGITTAELRDYMIERFKKDPRIPKKQKEQWMNWLQGPLENQFRRVELTKIYKAAFIPNFADLCQNFHNKYYEYLKALNRPGVSSASRSSMSGSNYVNTQQMEQFLQDIERADGLSINTAQADKFRTNYLVAVRVYNEEHGTTVPPYTCHEGLKRCIESFVLRQAKDITGVIGLSNLSEEEKKRVDGAKARLIAEHGYCEYTAQKLLVEVAMTRDFLTA